MFTESKYTTLYYRIINSARARQSIGYTERHHIVPKCMGGDNTLSNIVILTAREHFICHRILIKIVEEKFKSKMIYAAWQQSRSAKYKGVRITSRTFAKLREELSKSYTDRKRSQFSEEWRENMSKAHLGKKVPASDKLIAHLRKITAERNDQHGPANPFYGKTHSHEVIANIIKSNSTVYSCPHCTKSGKSNSMKRWHFDNCKFTK